MSNKFGSMFDDDELGVPAPPAADSEQASTPPADHGLLNDEARELINAQAKAAVETSKQAAKAGLSATLKAGERLAAKAKETKDRVQARPDSGRRMKALAIGAVLLAVVGAVAWFLFKPENQGTKPEATSAPMMPAIPAAPVGVQPERPTPVVDAAPAGEDIQVAKPEPIPADTQETEPAPMPMFSPGAFEAEAAKPKAEPARAEEPVAVPVAAPPLVAKPVEAAKSQSNRPASRPRQIAVPQVGEKEQQQIDTIKAFEQQLSGQNP